jgi:aspartate racemase
VKTIGLLGGMTWHSTLEYYRLINEGVQAELGGSHSARCVLVSVEFDEFERLQVAGDWKRLTELMVEAARNVERAGADFLVICANTMHRTADDIVASVKIPLLHIADAAAEAVKAQGLKTVGLLGTRYTMEQDFYRKRLKEKHGLRILIPAEPDLTTIHTVIYEELARGVIREESRRAYLDIIAKLAKSGAEGIILGCTEIPLLIRQDDCELPLFDTTALHAAAAVRAAIS